MWICAGVVGLDSEELDLDLETDGRESPFGIQDSDFRGS